MQGNAQPRVIEEAEISMMSPDITVMQHKSSVSQIGKPLSYLRAFKVNCKDIITATGTN